MDPELIAPAYKRFKAYEQPERNAEALEAVLDSEITVDQLHDESAYDVFGIVMRYAEEDNGELIADPEVTQMYHGSLKHYQPLDEEVFIDTVQHLYDKGRNYIESKDVESREDFQDLDQSIRRHTGMAKRIGEGEPAASPIFHLGLAEGLDDLDWQFSAEEYLDEHSGKEIIVEQ